jgi:YfiH family protein
MKLIVPNWTGVPSNIGAFTTTRIGGVSQGPYDDGAGSGGLNLGVHVGDQLQDVQKNRDLLQKHLPAEPAWLSQVHGVTVVNAADVTSVTGAPEADASIATQPGVVCVIQTADCLPVLFCDARGRVVGAAHAGWRGLAHGVLENTVAQMRNAGAENIIAWLGPAIGPQSFEVGAEVMQVFTERDSQAHTAFKKIESHAGKYLADIYHLARLSLRRIGIEQIYGGEFCTVMQREHFYSYRRDKVTGRMASLIWIK